MDEKPSIHKENRKGPDIILRVIDLSSAILWGFLLVNLGVVISAKPEGATFFDRLFEVSVRDYWDYALLKVALILSLFQFGISIISLYLNSRRLKRKSDRIRISIIISLFASLILCVLLTLILFM